MGPFLAMRMYVIIERNVINHMLLFFTLKNFIMFCLEIYRILVIALEEEEDEEDDDSIDMTNPNYQSKSRNKSRNSRAENKSRAKSSASRNSNRSRSASRQSTKSRSASRQSAKSNGSNKVVPMDGLATDGTKPSGLFSAFSKLGEKTRKLQNKL